MVRDSDEALSADVVIEDPRERLFAATAELVSKRGLRDTSVEQIVAAADVSDATFQGLFEDKEACFLAAFDRIVADAMETLAEAVSVEEEWPGQMAAGLSCLLDLVVADPRRARVALVESQAAGPRAYSRYKQALDRAAPMLREGRRYSKDAASLPGTLEEAVLGGITWVVHQRLAKAELEETDFLLGEMIQIALSPYLGEEEARSLAATTVRDRSGGR